MKYLSIYYRNILIKVNTMQHIGVYIYIYYIKINISIYIVYIINQTTRNGVNFNID